MPNALHSAQTPTDGIHIIHAFVYADAAARTGAVGITANDIGKVARQLSDNTFWVLTNNSPLTWSDLTAGGTPAIEIKDEGISIGLKSKINFVGPGLTAATDGGDATQANVTLTTAAPISVGTSNTAGVADSVSRSDHQHKGPFLQSVFAEIAADTTTTSAAFVTLLSQAITIQAGSILLIHFTVSNSHSTNNQTGYFRIQVDGVTVRAAANRNGTSGEPGSCSIVLRRTGLAVGAHTVTVQWRTSGGTIRVRPITAPDQEHASLLLEEVTL